MKCFVTDCRSDFRGPQYARQQTKYTRHRFPPDPERRAAWLYAIARAENRKLNVDGINFDAVRLCSNHFSQSDFYIAKGRRLLHKSAVPCLFGDDAVENGQRYALKCMESGEFPQSIPPPIKIKKLGKETQRQTKALIDDVLECFEIYDPPEASTVFRLEKFPHVCRLCLKAPKSRTEVMIPVEATNYLLGGISIVEFISEVLPNKVSSDMVGSLKRL